ncbi:MAG: glycosyltransferase family 4 protein [Candidatus Komeilibacteria bacterium]|nr:glycosyltransferase family 4 protein [Candidatus Komeilibacteria bacterium]
MPDKIKLAFIVCGLSWGGAERMVLDIIKHLPKEIYEIHLLTVMGSGDLLPWFTKTGVTVKIFHKTSKLGLGTLWQIKKYLQAQRIAVVHTHLFAGDTWGRLAAWLAKIPIIVSTEHNINLDEGRSKKILKKILSLVSDKIIAVSDEVKDYQICHEKIKESKITVIHNGIDFSRFPYKNDYCPQNPVRLGILGRLEEQKGHEVAFKALLELKKMGLKAHLIIKGEGSLKEPLTQLAADLNVQRQLIWETPGVKVRDFFHQLDFLIIPSKWEGFGLVAAEAMACGIPVIAARTGGLMSVISDYQTGFFFKNGDYLDLARLINNLRQETGLLEKVRKNARRKALKQFDIKKTVKHHENMYLKLYYENIIGQQILLP